MTPKSYPELVEDRKRTNMSFQFEHYIEPWTNFITNARFGQVEIPSRGCLDLRSTLISLLPLATRGIMSKRSAFRLFMIYCISHRLFIKRDEIKIPPNEEMRTYLGSILDDLAKQSQTRTGWFESKERNWYFNPDLLGRNEIGLLLQDVEVFDGDYTQEQYDQRGNREIQLQAQKEQETIEAAGRWLLRTLAQ